MGKLVKSLFVGVHLWTELVSLVYTYCPVLFRKSSRRRPKIIDRWEGVGGALGGGADAANDDVAASPEPVLYSF
jgi:hypothetical protein